MATNSEAVVVEDSSAYDEDLLQGKYLSFQVDRVDYGIEIRFVTEIIGIQTITEVPDMPEYVKGVINLRGNVIPIMDVRSRFRLPTRDYEERTCIIVINVEEMTVGLVVDKVNEVIEIPVEQIEPPPKTKYESSKYIKGLGKVESDVKILLEVTRLLNRDEIEPVAEP